MMNILHLLNICSNTYFLCFIDEFSFIDEFATIVDFFKQNTNLLASIFVNYYLTEAMREILMTKWQMIYS